MAETIRVESVESLRRFRTAMVKFVDTARSALIDAQMDLQQTQQWLQNEQRSHWQGQLQKREQALNQAKDALRQKQLFKTQLSSAHAGAEEEKALARAKAALEEAQRKAAAVQQWGRRLTQESVQYSSIAQRMRNQVDLRLPEAIATLDQLATALEAYLALAAPAGSPASAAPSAGQETLTAEASALSMARSPDEEMIQPGTMEAALPPPQEDHVGQNETGQTADQAAREEDGAPPAPGKDLA